jgi:YggT family protein
MLCFLEGLLSRAVTLYTIVLFVYAIVSWIPDLRGRWVYYLGMLVEPVLQPIRRIVPPMGGFDVAFLVLFLVLQFVVQPLIGMAMRNSCSILY